MKVLSVWYPSPTLGEKAKDQAISLGGMLIETRPMGRFAYTTFSVDAEEITYKLSEALKFIQQDAEDKGFSFQTYACDFWFKS